MKKLFTILLSFVMILSLSVTAFAADITDTAAGNNTASGNVTATYTPSSTGSGGSSDVVSVDIVWGAMSFTYDDTVADGATEENGWSCADGANQVTVTNSGTVAVNALVVYTAAQGYTEISGQFDKDSAALAAQASETFTLTLSGKPDMALSGDKIGSVTVTITGSTITDLAGLQQLQENFVGSATLGADIAMGDNTVTFLSGTQAVLDLNGKTISSGYSSFYVNPGAALTVKDSNGTGKIKATGEYNSAVYVLGELTLQGGTLIGGNAIYVDTGAVAEISAGTVTGDNASLMNSGEVTISGGNFTGRVQNFDGTITISGGTFDGDIWEDGGSIIITGGTFSVDPTDFVDTDSYTVTENGNGTWTVTAK